jgi:hypothetical protein
MSTIDEALQWMDLDKRCGGPEGHCLKCDGALRQKFDSADSVTRNTLASILCSCTVEDFLKHQALQWLIALLDVPSYERFVAGIARLAPYSPQLAWQIIQFSHRNKGNRCFMLGPERVSRFKPRFHLHPAIAPALLAATIRPGAGAEEVITLLDCFEPVANDYPVLKQALPLWRAELVRREEERKADWLRHQEQDRAEAAKRQAERTAREQEFLAVEARGTLAVINAILEASGWGSWDCPDRWAKTPEKELALVAPELLGQVIQKVGHQPPSRHWNGFRNRIEHLLKSRAHAAERSAWLAQFEGRSSPEKLHAACNTRWSLTYLPDNWAEETIKNAAVLPEDLKARMLTKVSRLSRRSPWRTVRRMLREAKPCSANQPKSIPAPRNENSSKVGHRAKR